MLFTSVCVCLDTFRGSDDPVHVNFGSEVVLFHRFYIALHFMPV